MFVFFFKKKTAYEMRISDWSSDVCSSDLHPLAHAAGKLVRILVEALPGGRYLHPLQHLHRPGARFPAGNRTVAQHHLGNLVADAVDRVQRGHRLLEDHRDAIAADRSEEHTSELQSLMRISYAVFCLKKNTHTNHPATLLSHD